MKRHIERWAKFKERALSRSRQPLTRSRRGSRLNTLEVLTLHLVEYLEHEVLPEKPSAKAEVLIEAIHDWKEMMRNGH